MAKDKQPGRMVRLSVYTTVILSDLSPACQEYWNTLDSAAGREPSKLSASDVIRTALGLLRTDLLRRGFLKEQENKN